MTQKDEHTIKEALDKAVTAIKGGDLETGKANLRWVLEREPNNVLAWLWMSRCAPTNEAKLECFNRVLAIDPSNKHAQEGIQRYGGGDKIQESPASHLASSAAPSARVSAKQPRSVEMSEKPKRRLMSTERAPVGWGLWLLWVFANVMGLLVLEVTTSAAGAAGGDADIIVLMVGLVVLSTLQWLILRRLLPKSGWWVLTGVVGFFVGGTLIAVFIEFPGALDSDSVEATLMRAVIIGASIGIAQWLVLRRRVRLAGLWVLAIILGEVAAQPVGEIIVNKALQDVGAAFHLVSIGVGVTYGAIFGAITGGVLVWLLRQPVTKEPSPAQEAD